MRQRVRIYELKIAVSAAERARYIADAASAELNFSDFCRRAMDYYAEKGFPAAHHSRRPLGQGRGTIALATSGDEPGIDPDELDSRHPDGCGEVGDGEGEAEEAEQ